MFSIVPTFEDALANVGVETDGVRTSALAGGLDPLGGISPPMARVLQANVDSTYREFVNLVARGRNMTPEDVDAVAQGRVWSGQDAITEGLADTLGGLDVAIREAAALADLENYGVKVLSTPASARDLLLNELLGSSVASPAPAHAAWLNGLSQLLRYAAQFDDPGHSYALCLNCPAR